jgi:dTDP-4-amino-4,6-dideoxygalactose transaminase
MIELFKIPNHIINTACYSSLLHDRVVREFEETICQYTGAKHACSFSSATNAIFLLLVYLRKSTGVLTLEIPSILPSVVANAIRLSGHNIKFVDKVDWVGNSYVLADLGNFKIIDSAQEVTRNQFRRYHSEDMLIFSFYPTKPIGSCDGGMIVSNSYNILKELRIDNFNGTTSNILNWERELVRPGWKMYMNSIQADIGLRNLEKLDERKETLSRIRDQYNKAFKRNNKSFHLYRIDVPDNKSFINRMKEKQIQCGIHYPALHKTKVYHSDILLPLSEEEEKTTVSIPFHPFLAQEEINYVCRTIKDNI